MSAPSSHYHHTRTRDVWDPTDSIQDRREEQGSLTGATRVIMRENVNPATLHFLTYMCRFTDKDPAWLPTQQSGVMPSL